MVSPVAFIPVAEACGLIGQIGRFVLQRACAEFAALRERMGPLARVRIYARVAVPLILGAMVKAQQLEVVLQSKGFTGSPQRTFLHESRLQTRDHVTLVLSTLGFAALLWLYLAHGVGKFRWGLPW